MRNNKKRARLERSLACFSILRMRVAWTEQVGTRILENMKPPTPGSSGSSYPPIPLFVFMLLLSPSLLTPSPAPPFSLPFPSIKCLPYPNYSPAGLLSYFRMIQYEKTVHIHITMIVQRVQVFPATSHYEVCEVILLFFDLNVPWKICCLYVDFKIQPNCLEDSFFPTQMEFLFRWKNTKVMTNF